MIYNENQFRQFLKCKKLYSYQTDYSFPHIEIEILQTLFSRISSLYLKNKSYPTDNFYSDLVTILNRYNKKHSFLESQYDRILNSLILYCSQLFRYFDVNQYYPIFGPVYLNKSISQSTIKIKLNGIFRNENQTLHLVFFSPYLARLNILNDPILHFSTQEFNQFVKNHKSNRPKVTVHIFYYKNYKDLGYINYQPQGTNSNYVSLLRDVESKNYTPVVPCLYKCKYKNKCEGIK